MKKRTLLGFLCVMLVGCDSAKGLVPFTPEVTSFSNEFDFDPLRGPMKDFSQTLPNDKGEVIKCVAGTPSQEGCFDILELHDIENSTGMVLVLDASYYRDVETLEKQVRLQGRCQLAGPPVAGMVWDTNDNDSVVSAMGKEIRVQYRYDVEGYPLGKITVGKGSILQVDAKSSVGPLKKLDYIAVSILNNRPLGNVKQTCKYDEYADPINYQSVIVGESVKPVAEHHYSTENTTDYY